VVLVDGQPQRRRGQKRDAYVVKEPLPHVWISEPGFDYAEATFDESFGGSVGRNVSQTRAVLFVKPDFWVVLDTMTAKDGNNHTYEAMFHFDGNVKVDGLRLFTADAGEPNLTVAARPDPGLTLSVVEGQENPVQGWLPGGLSRVRPAPVGIYKLRGGTVRMLYVLAPAVKGAPDPVRSVEAIGGDPTAARITFTNGRTREVRFRTGQAPLVK
jgi:hypothetical protein